MRHILIATAALAVGGFIAAGPALAQQAPNYQPGGPHQVAGWCKVVSSHDLGSDAYGYYKPCAAPGTYARAGVAQHYR